MAKQYVFIRMPVDVFNVYKDIKVKMETDMSGIAGRPIKMTMPKVFMAVASPQFNENFIRVDIKKLLEFAQGQKK